MEVKINPSGHKSYPLSLKKQILDFLESGKTVSELSREYQIPLQNIHRWHLQHRKAKEANYAGKDPVEVISKSDHLKQVAELEKQIKNLKRSLADMAVDRDILKDAVDIASKKKWI